MALLYFGGGHQLNVRFGIHLKALFNEKKNLPSDFYLFENRAQGLF